MGYYPVRVKFGIILLISLALFSNIRLLKKEFEFNRDYIGRDYVTWYEKRFEGLKGILPARGVVGYISDKRPEEIATDPELTRGYYLTEYALSPIIVDNNLGHELIIGNFHKPITAPNSLKYRGLAVFKDFGNGVVLFKAEVK